MRYAGLDAERAINGRANYEGAIRRELELTTLAARADNTLVDAFGLLWSQPFPRFSIPAPAPRASLNSKFPRGPSCNLFLEESCNFRSFAIFMSLDFAGGHLLGLEMSLRPLEDCLSSH